MYTHKTVRKSEFDHWLTKITDTPHRETTSFGWNFLGPQCAASVRDAEDVPSDRAIRQLWWAPGHDDGGGWERLGNQVRDWARF